MVLTQAHEIGYALDFNEMFLDSMISRAILQNNEDKIEEFNKWSENMVRFVKTILDEASKMAEMLPNLEIQIGKFSNFQESFGVHKSVEALDTISNLLKNTQSSNYKLVTNINTRLLVSLQKYFQEDFRELKDLRKSFDKTSERYDVILNRYYSLSKFKDVSDLDLDLAQLYDSRINYYEQYLEYGTKINNFKEVIDLLFLEKMTILIDDLSDFFKNLSENFQSVKLQLDNVRGEFARMNKKSEENRTKNESSRSEMIQKIKEKWNPSASIVRKLSSDKVGHLLMKKKKALGTPWKRVYARILDGQFYFESLGKIRGTLEMNEKMSILLCEIRPLDYNDRRFCFEVYTGQLSQVYQAESEDDMMDWINTFHTAKSEMLQKRKSEGNSSGPIIPASVIVESSREKNTEFEYGNQLILKRWNEEFHRRFENLSDDEVVLCSFPASLHTDIWTQGRVFVSQFAVYFYSSLFGIGTKITIPLKEIMKIDVVQTSFVTLANFSLAGDSKDLTLKLFNSVDGSNDRFIDHLQFLHRNTQSVEPLNGKMLFIELQQSSMAEPESVHVQPDVDSLADLDIAATNANEDPLPMKEISCGCSTHMDLRQVNTVIPIDCTIAYGLMFGPDCPVQHAVQARRNNRNYKITDWKMNSEGIEERLETYMFPLNNPLVRMKETECFVTMTLSKCIPGKCYVIDCEARAPNVPYADSFYTKTRYCITWAGQDQTRLSICIGLVWLKSPFVKSIIKSATHKTFVDTCSDYMICLRHEIAAKIGKSAVAAEQAIQLQTTEKLQAEISPSFENENNTKHSSILNQFKSKLSEICSSSNSTPLICIILASIVLAFFIGWFARPRYIYHTIGSYDLESEVFSEYNISKIPEGSQRKWLSAKFYNSHTQLDNLHHEFLIIRKNIWLTLQRLNDMEKRIYQAQSVALLGDKLLNCLDFAGRNGLKNPSKECINLQNQWQNMIERE